MKRFTLLLTLMLLPFICNAERGQSIMFGDPDPIYTEKTRDTSAEKQAEHCKQLRQEMEALKGKPQRYHAASQRYKLECQPPQ